MKKRGRTPESEEYEFGYGKPPSETKFGKGASGNPGGRPRGMTAGRTNQLALKEAYRPVTVREGDKVLTMTAVQAVLRSLVASAAKGCGPAERNFLETVQVIEREGAARVTARHKAKGDTHQTSDLDAARRIAFLLSKTSREREQPQPSQPAPSLLIKKERIRD